jgi:hypothetical protein
LLNLALPAVVGADTSGGSLGHRQADVVGLVAKESVTELGSSRWASKIAFGQCAVTQSASVTGSASQAQMY